FIQVIDVLRGPLLAEGGDVRGDRLLGDTEQSCDLRLRLPAEIELRDLARALLDLYVLRLHSSCHLPAPMNTSRLTVQMDGFPTHRLLPVVCPRDFRSRSRLRRGADADTLLPTG